MQCMFMIHAVYVCMSRLLALAMSSSQLPIQALFANWQDLYEEVDAVQIFGSPRHVANHPRMQTTVDRLMLQQMLL